MFDSKKIDEVITKLEKAEGPSGNLDNMIYGLLGYRRVMAHHIRGGALNQEFWLRGGYENEHLTMGGVPAYTFNLEDARGLIEVGFLFSVEGNASAHQQGKYGVAKIWCAPEYSGIESMVNVQVEAKAATPAIALCIAALKTKKRWETP